MYIPLLSRHPRTLSSTIETPMPRDAAGDGLFSALDVFERRAPAGGGGGGGGARGGGGVSSSSGSRGSSGGSKGTSGSTGSGAKSVGSGASKQSISGLAGGQSRVSPATSASGSRAQIFGPSGSTSRSFGGNRPIAGAPLPLYGFWPIYWDTDDTDPAHPSNDTRPGGALAQAGIELPANESQIYILFGDRFSLDAVLAPILAQTGAQNVSLPTDLSHNVTVQEYRDQSFQLLRLNDSAMSDANSSFLPTLNQSVGQALPIGAASQLSALIWPASAVVALAGVALMA